MSYKIKTITCHEVYNYGASLQEFALLYYLQNKGYEVETIRYKPPYLSGHFSLKVVSNAKYDLFLIRYLYLIAKLPERIKDLKRKKAFDIFSHKYIPSTSITYTSNEELKNNLPKSDAFICGSDQIWNSYFQNGKDPAFYLDFVPDYYKKISYAASFATDNIDDSLKPFVKKSVSRIQHISVREISACKLLENLGIDNAIQVLDPVFLITAKEWETKFVTPINEDYVFIYDFDNNKTVEELAKEIAKANKWKIFTVNKNIKYADKNFYLEGPEKFLSLMRYSKFTITNSFHSVAFSIIFNKQFIVINRKEEINTRMRDLLQIFNLSHLLVNSSFSSNSIKSIDYSTINCDLEKAIKKSEAFLLNALSTE